MIINLRELFSNNFDSEWESVFNCIYRVRNILNDKSYIGQAKNFLYRFNSSSGFCHKFRLTEYCINDYNHSHFYSSIRKYGSKNFEVIILEKDLDIENLSDRESYWIKHFHTCRFDENCNGYNMTWGGENCDQLNTPEARRKSYETRLKNGTIDNWIIAAHAPDVVKKKWETMLRTGGAYRWIDSAHTPEIDEKRWETMLRTGSAYRWMDATHSPESYENNRKNHGGVLAYNLPKSIQTKLINYINGVINSLKDKSIPITPLNYLKVVSFNHIETVCCRLYDDPSIRLHPNWTSEMESLFTYFDDEINFNNLVTQLNIMTPENKCEERMACYTESENRMGNEKLAFCPMCGMQIKETSTHYECPSCGFKVDK